MSLSEALLQSGVGAVDVLLRLMDEDSGVTANDLVAQLEHQLDLSALAASASGIARKRALGIV